jgi:hypothetical protein
VSRRRNSILRGAGEQPLQFFRLCPPSTGRSTVLLAGLGTLPAACAKENVVEERALLTHRANDCRSQQGKPRRSSEPALVCTGKLKLLLC